MATVATKALISSSIKWSIGGWSFFIVENYILSENRTYLISNLGDEVYHAAYGTLSTVAMGSVFYGYFRKVKNSQPLLWSLSSPAPFHAKIASFVCLSVGLGIASQIPPKIQIPVHFVRNTSNNINTETSDISQEGALNTSEEIVEQKGFQIRCPFDFTDNKDTTSPVHGLERITRHPGLWSFGLIGLGNALLVPSLPTKAFFAMPSLVALINGAHIDSRFRRGMGGELTKEYDDATSNIPFLALFSGAQGNVLTVLQDFSKEVKPLNALVAVGLSGLWVLRKGRGMKLPLR